ncbi:MAG: hypothetical protein ACLTXI_01795 [Collinsella sp.]
MNKYKARGLKVGSNFNMLGGCIIDHSHCWLIRIGDNVTFAPRVHVLAHDASTKRVLGYTRMLTASGTTSSWSLQYHHAGRAVGDGASSGREAS